MYVVPRFKATEPCQQAGSIRSGIFEATPPESCKAAVIPYGDLKAALTVDAMTPFVASGIEWLQKMTQDGKLLDADVKRFKQIFGSSQIRTTTGRAQIKIATSSVPEVVAAVRNMFSETVAKKLHDVSSLKDNKEASGITQLLSPTVFGLADVKGISVHAAFDMNCSPCLRINIEGSRSIMLAPFTKLGCEVRALNAKSDAVQLSRPISSQAVQAWARGAAVANVNAMAEKAGMVFATLGPGDGIYIPPGFVVIEKPPGTSPTDVIGLRVGLLFAGTEQDEAAQQELRACVADCSNTSGAACIQGMLRFIGDAGKVGKLPDEQDKVEGTSPMKEAPASTAAESEASAEEAQAAKAKAELGEVEVGGEGDDSLKKTGKDEDDDESEESDLLLFCDLMPSLKLQTVRIRKNLVQSEQTDELGCRLALFSFRSQAT